MIRAYVRIGVWIGIACVLVAGAFALRFQQESVGIEGLDACDRFGGMGSMADPEFVACAAAVIGPLLDREGVEKTYALILSRFTPGRCHQFGHVLGEQLYSKSGSVEQALAQCSPACGSSCLHGATAAAFLAVPEVRASVEDLAHPNIGVILAEGKKLCANWETCHGVGHVLYSLSDTLIGSLGLCDAIGGLEIFTCYWGVFMENAVRGAPGLPSGDLVWPCLSVPDKYQEACFHLHHMQQEIVFEELGISSQEERQQRRFETCVGLPRQELRFACAENLGLSMYGRADTPADARAMCMQFGSERERATCFFGFIHAAVDYGEREVALGLCAAETSDMMRRACYEAAFESIRIRKSTRLEDACAGDSSTSCTDALARYMADPYDLVFSFYKMVKQ